MRIKIVRHALEGKRGTYTRFNDIAMRIDGRKMSGAGVCGTIKAATSQAVKNVREKCRFFQCRINNSGIVFRKKIGSAVFAGL